MLGLLSFLVGASMDLGLSKNEMARQLCYLAQLAGALLCYRSAFITEWLLSMKVVKTHLGPQPKCPHVSKHGVSYCFNSFLCLASLFMYLKAMLLHQVVVSYRPPFFHTLELQNCLS